MRIEKRIRLTVKIINLIVMILSTGCWKEDIPITIILSIRVSDVPISPISVYADRKMVGTFEKEIVLPDGSWEEARIRFQGFPYRKGEPYLLPKLEVRALTPCGWQQAKLHIDYVEKAAKAAKEGKPMVVLSRMETISAPVLELWVDNRNGNSFDLSLGQVKKKITAKFRGRQTLYSPTCAEGRRVRINEREFAALPDEISSLPDVLPSPLELEPMRQMPSRSFLLDPLGNRCYLFREVLYGMSGVGEYKQTGSLRYDRKRLHWLPPNFVHQFLEEAPDSVAVLLWECRNVLTEVPCSE